MVDASANVVSSEDALLLPKGFIILAIPETVDTKDLQPLLRDKIVLDVRNK